MANSHAEVSVDMPIVNGFRISKAYPNPFNPTTTMTLIMPVPGDITVEVYNLLGQAVTTLASGYRKANAYNLTWDASSYSSGVYFITLSASDTRLTQKVLLLK